MNLEDSLLVIRLYSVLTTLADKLGNQLDKNQFTSLFDEERILAERRLVLSLELQAGQCILIIERYIFRRHQLAITHYNYALFSAEGTPIFSCDNASHHPEVGTFPHHKHHYPGVFCLTVAGDFNPRC